VGLSDVGQLDASHKHISNTQRGLSLWSVGLVKTDPIWIPHRCVGESTMYCEEKAR